MYHHIIVQKRVETFFMTVIIRVDMKKSPKVTCIFDDVDTILIKNDFMLELPAIMTTTLHRNSPSYNLKMIRF